jgi:predicted ATPase/DNA-binding CsgD family transcriptional regulator
MPNRAGAKIGNLPPALTSFVGRRQDGAQVKRLLSSSRSLTLIGTGGVGKTRLALRVAEESRRAFRDGVWLVELDRLRDDALIAQAVAGALGLSEQPGRPPVEALAEYLHGRQLLLVLDNCEHLVDAAAKLADRLLRTAPELQILATSREPLTILGEVLYLVPPLSAPDPWRPVPLPDMPRYDAVRLFAERAVNVAPGFQLTEANKTAVADICHLLDGLPLAIELAAARLRVLAPDQIRDRLADRLAVLTRGPRSAAARQQTLRACVDWSYTLCTQAERHLWARLSVFAGGFELGAAEDVCDSGGLAAEDLFELIASLIDKSILVRDGQGDAARYRMLETLRDYGAERLAELAETDQIQRRHRDHFATLAERAEAAWTGPDQLRWSQTLNREHANIQAAIEYCLRQPTEVAAGQELAARLWFFWIACGHLREGRYYLDRALARGGEGHPRRWALWACAFVAGSQGDLEVAEALVEQCGAEATATADSQLDTYATETQAMILAIRGDLDAAVARMLQCLAYYRSLDTVDAGLLRTLPMLGVTLVMRGEFDAALELALECQQLCERLGERWQRSYVDHFVGLALHGKQDPARAVEHFAAAIETKHQVHDIVGLLMCIEPLAGATADLGDGPRTATLLGAAEQLRQAFGLSSSGSSLHSAEHRRAEQRARELLTTAKYERAFTDGQAMNLDETVAYALTGIRPQPPHLESASAPPADPLTPREMQVAELVGQGLTNREIAARLVISTRTAESHLEHILAKLGFVNRTQLAAWITTRGQQHQRPDG